MGVPRALFAALPLLLPCLAAVAGDSDGEVLWRLLARHGRSIGTRAGPVPARDPAPANPTSLRGNATVSIGGEAHIRHTNHIGRTFSQPYAVAGTPPRVLRDARGNPLPAGPSGRQTDLRTSQLHLSQARLKLRVDTGGRAEAYFQIDLQHDPRRRANVAGLVQKCWLRWKSPDNGGFGLLAGRNDLVFTDRFRVGEYTGFLGMREDAASLHPTRGVTLDGWRGGDQGEGMFSHRGTLSPNHTGWDLTRTTQITPHWESAGGVVRVDLSLLQSAERLDGHAGSFARGSPGADGVRRYRSINYGLGSGTFRVMWKPMPGLFLTASAANFYQANQRDGHTNRPDGRRGTSAWAAGHPEWIARNATAVNLSLRWTPSFLPAWTLWSKWIHGWNDGWTRRLDSDAFNLGLAYKPAESWTCFAQGDLFRNTNKRQAVEQWRKGRVWAVYLGVIRRLPYGVNLEAGWRRENAAYANRVGATHTRTRLDSIYSHIGFAF